MAVGTQTPPDNSKIVNEMTHIPSAKDRVNFVPLTEDTKYLFMMHAYHGTGGFRDGSYVIPHPREVFYDARRQLAFYKNFTAPVVDAMVNPVFHDPIKRQLYVNGTVKESGLLAHAFLDDADNAGQSFHDLMRDAVTFAILQGVTFVVMDNFPVQPQGKTDAIATRTLPYAYLKKAHEYVESKTDRFGRLEWIIFTDDPDLTKTATGRVIKEERFVKYDAVNRVVMKKAAAGAGYVELESVPHGLFRVPIVPIIFGKKKSSKEIMVEPPHYDIAKLNYAIFNKDSEVRDQERAQGFAVLYVQTENVGNITLGVHNALIIPMGANIEPGYASPPPEILTMLRKGNEELRDDLFRIAGQRGVIGIQEAKSGVAMQWEFRAEEHVSQMVSQRAKAAEMAVFALFEEYAMEGAELESTYPTEFAPRDEINELDQVERVLDMGMPTKASVLLKKKAFTAVTVKEDQEDVDAALEEFDAFEEETRQNKDAAAAAMAANFAQRTE